MSQIKSMLLNPNKSVWERGSYSRDPGNTCLLYLIRESKALGCSFGDVQGGHSMTEIISLSVFSTVDCVCPVSFRINMHGNAESTVPHRVGTKCRILGKFERSSVRRQNGHVFCRRRSFGTTARDTCRGSGGRTGASTTPRVSGPRR
jgi:hypothetical protein